MKINIKTILYAYAIVGLLSACGGDDMLPETPLTDYPQKYVLTGLDFQPTEYFEYQPNGFQQIYPQAVLSILVDTIDAILLTESYQSSGITETIREIELLSDTLARILIIEDDFTNTTLDTTFCYAINEDKIRLFSCGFPEQEFIEFNWSPENKQISYCLQWYFYLYFDESLDERTFSPLIGDVCYADDKMAILDRIVVEESNLDYLQFQDTIMLNVSPVILELEE